MLYLFRCALKSSAKVQQTHRWLWVNVGLRGTTRDKVRQNTTTRDCGGLSGGGAEGRTSRGGIRKKIRDTRLQVGIIEEY